MACGSYLEGVTYFPEWELINVIAWSRLREYGEQYGLREYGEQYGLREYGEQYGPDAARQLRAWYQEAKEARWSRPQDIRDQFPTASFVGEETVIFNICGGRYRLIIKVWYSGYEVYVKFFGTHEEYDRIRADEL